MEGRDETTDRMACQSNPLSLLDRLPDYRPCEVPLDTRLHPVLRLGNFHRYLESLLPKTIGMSPRHLTTALRDPEGRMLVTGHKGPSLEEVDVEVVAVVDGAGVEGGADDCLWSERSTNTYALVGIELEMMESCDAFGAGHPTSWLVHKSRAVQTWRTGFSIMIPTSMCFISSTWFSYWRFLFETKRETTRLK